MTDGYLKVEAGAHVYFNYQNRGRGLPTLVLLNGLSDDTESWSPLIESLSQPCNILRLDLMGQGRAVEKDLERGLRLRYKWTVHQQAEALKCILDTLAIQDPVDLVGFSYGGGVALEFSRCFPEKIKRLFLWLPYIIRLDQAHPLQRLWNRQFRALKSLPGPSQLGFQVVENVYGNFLHQYMHQRFRPRIPDQRMREIAVQLSEGIMPFNAFEILSQLPAKPIHLVTVERDTLVPAHLYQEFWGQLPSSLKTSWLQIQDGEHLILEQAPLYMARWLEYLLSHDQPFTPLVCKGQWHAMEWFTDQGEPVKVS